MAKDNNDISVESVDYLAMAKRWELLHDLMGGTQAMRTAGEKWLPREPAESIHAYSCRLNRSFLFGAFEDTITNTVAKPFSKPVTIKNAPVELEYLEHDVDGSGKNITQFEAECFQDLTLYGKTHVLVDFSKIDTGLTKAEEKEAGARASFVRVSPPSLIGWQTDDDGKLIQIRYRFDRTEADGAYGDKKTPHVKMISPEGYEVWRKDEKADKYIQTEKGIHSFGRIFLVTVYARQIGFLTANPPLENLAWLNLHHWQSDSDQNNILRFSRFGIMFMSGITEEEYDSSVEFGPSQIFRTTSDSADLKYVEHHGYAIDAGRKDLEDTEHRMEIVGAQPLTKNTGKNTATAKNIDEGRNVTSIQRWIKASENGLRQMYELAAEWHGVTLPEDFGVDIYSDFKVSLYSDKDVDTLLKSCQANKLTNETYLEEIKRRGLLSESVDLEAETAALADLSSIGEFEDVEPAED